MASTLWFQQPLGAAFSGAKLYHYAVGTSTLKNVYPTKADADAQTNALAQPVVLDSTGWAQVWLDGTYKLVLKNSAESVTYYTVDNVGDASDINTLPKNHIAGLITSYVSTTSLSIAAGECRDAADTTDMTLASAATVSTGSTGAGALDTGTIANSTMYAVWLISDSSGANDTKGLLSTSFSAPTVPTGYDKKRLIGGVKTNGSAELLTFTQAADHFYYGNALTDVNDSTITANTFETGTISAPPSSIAHMFVSGSNDTALAEIRVTLRRVGSTVASADGFGQLHVETNASNMLRIGGHVSILLDSSRQLEYAAAEGSGTASVGIETIGFTMLTRSNPV